MMPHDETGLRLAVRWWPRPARAFWRPLTPRTIARMPPRISEIAPYSRSQGARRCPAPSAATPMPFCGSRAAIAGPAGVAADAVGLRAVGAVAGRGPGSRSRRDSRTASGRGRPGASGRRRDLLLPGSPGGVAGRRRRRLRRRARHRRPRGSAGRRGCPSRSAWASGSAGRTGRTRAAGPRGRRRGARRRPGAVPHHARHRGRPSAGRARRRSVSEVGGAAGWGRAPVSPRWWHRAPTASCGRRRPGLRGGVGRRGPRVAGSVGAAAPAASRCRPVSQALSCRVRRLRVVGHARAPLC